MITAMKLLVLLAVCVLLLFLQVSENSSRALAAVNIPDQHTL
jgi:hypothetical protein